MVDLYIACGCNATVLCTSQGTFIHYIYENGLFNCYVDIIFLGAAQFMCMHAIYFVLMACTWYCALVSNASTLHNVTSFMQYAYYVQFTTSFNTQEPIYICIYVKNDKRLFGRSWIDRMGWATGLEFDITDIITTTKNCAEIEDLSLYRCQSFLPGGNTILTDSKN